MTVKNSTEHLSKEEIMDDMKEEIQKESTAEGLDLAKLAALKAKIEGAKKEAPKAPSEKKPCVKFGIVGSGQCGNRLAEMFYMHNVDIVCLNTAQADLDNIKVPSSNKVLLDNNVGGSAKSLELGEAAAAMHADQIKEAVNAQLADAEVIVLATSLGGGSGAGSLPVLVDILNEIGKPIVAIVVLPQDSDDGLSKNNALVTLSKLSKLTQDKKVSNIICIDNAKIEQIYHDANQLDFFPLANKEIVSTFNAMNQLANSKGITKAIDKMEWLKILLDGEGFSIYGSLKVTKFTDELDIIEALMTNLENNLLSGSFDIKQAKYCGVFMSATEAVWKQIPSSGINYCMSSINSDFAAPLGVFKGTWVDESVPEGTLMVHFFYSGLGLPTAKINALKAEVEQLNVAIKSKADNRHMSLEFNVGGDKTQSKTEEIKAKIAAKNSTFGKFINTTIDRRGK